MITYQLLAQQLLTLHFDLFLSWNYKIVSTILVRHDLFFHFLYDSLHSLGRENRLRNMTLMALYNSLKKRNGETKCQADPVMRAH